MDGGTRRQIAHYLVTVDSVILELGCCEERPQTIEIVLWYLFRVLRQLLVDDQFWILFLDERGIRGKARNTSKMSNRGLEKRDRRKDVMTRTQLFLVRATSRLVLCASGN